MTPLRLLISAALLTAILCALAPAQDAAPPNRPPTSSDTQAAPAPQTPAPPTAPSVPDYLPTSLPSQIAMLLSDPAVAQDHWGIMVTNLQGEIIFGLNQEQLFQPASNTKLFTTAAALALLGADHRFATQVVASGDIKKGILHGDLKLVGGGDPSFGSADLPYVPPAERPKAQPSATTSPAIPPPLPIADIEELADAVVAKGIREIQGNIVGDDQRFSWEGYPDSWNVGDLLWGYGAPVSALTIHDNEINVTIGPDPTPHPSRSLPALIGTTPDVPYYTIQDHVLTMALGTGGCDARLLFRRPPGSKALDISGDIHPSAVPCTEHIAIEDPAEYAALALKLALERRGVRISGSATAQHWDPERLPGAPGVDINRMPDTPADRNRVDGFLQSVFSNPLGHIACGAQRIGTGGSEPLQTVLAEHTSAPLADDVLYTNKVSQNLHAEVFLRDVGAGLTCEPDVPNSLNVVRQWLLFIGIDPNDFVFYDGSGLSSHDLLTPRAIAKLLQFATTQPWFAAWKASLPIGGEDGTLESRFANPPLKDHLFAKTGTLGEARALSGYLDAASGRTVIFSILVDNHLPGTTADRDVMDKIVAAIQAAE